MKKKSFIWIAEIILVLLAFIFLVPFYFVAVNSLKTYNEILTETAGLPSLLQWVNYAKAWSAVNIPVAFRNSLINTFLTDIITMVLASMAAYRFARRPTRFNRIFMALFVASMVIPVQALVIPLVKEMSFLHIINTRVGLIVSYVGIGLSFSTFLYYGFIKSVSAEIEEAAVVDGCGPFRVFWWIVFPLIKPITVTVVLLKTLWCWNEFLLSLVLTPRQEMRTVQLSINALFSEYRSQWDIALPALVISVIPVILFFLFLQRHIIEGITNGAVKG